MLILKNVIEEILFSGKKTYMLGALMVVFFRNFQFQVRQKKQKKF